VVFPDPGRPVSITERLSRSKHLIAYEASTRVRSVRNRAIVPALMFHSVGLDSHPWIWSFLSEPVESFAAKVRLLRDRGFTGVFWQDLHGYMEGRTPVAPDSILLTFDDGYLDNWVYAFPILKKYGMRGTVFVNPEFVDPGTEVRPTLDDVWAGRCGMEERALKPSEIHSTLSDRRLERSPISGRSQHTTYVLADGHVPREIDNLALRSTVTQVPNDVADAKRALPVLVVSDPHPLAPKAASPAQS